MEKDMRTFMEELKKAGELHVIKKEVDPDMDMAAILQQTDKPILFEKLKNCPDFRVMGQMPATWKQVSMAFNTTRDGVMREYVRRLDRGLIKPEMVKSAPVKEKVWYGNEVDLNKIPVHIPIEGTTRYIPLGISVTKDPDTKIPNVSIHRLQIKGGNKTGIFFGGTRHARRIYSKYEERNEPMPIAIFNGHHPLMYYAACWNGPFGINEFEIAGSLLEEPVELVKCETVDLEVPANAEIVFEGEVPPKIREEEGPFAEYQGYASTKLYQNPIFNIKAVTMRKDPIYLTFQTTTPIRYGTIPMMEDIYRRLLELEEGGIEIRDLDVSPDYSLIIVQIHQKYFGQAKNVLMAALSGKDVYKKVAIVVDEDVDVHDPRDVMWALSTRVDPARDVFIVDGFKMDPMDPSLYRNEFGEAGGPYWYAIGSKMGIDATKPPSTLPRERGRFNRALAYNEGKFNIKDYLT